MTLPSSGAISFSQIRSEFGGGSGSIQFSDFYRGGSRVRAKAGNNSATNLAANVPSSGAIDMADFFGQARGFRKTYSSGATNQDASNIFGDDYGVDYPKEIVINSGVELGATSTSQEALQIDSGMSGSMTITNNGTLSGAGGSANGGTGGDAFEADVSCTLVNNGTIRSGGGGGGAGGTGGTGGTGGQGSTTSYGYGSWTAYRHTNTTGPGAPQYYQVDTYVNTAWYWYGAPGGNSYGYMGATGAPSSVGTTAGFGNYQYQKGPNTYYNAQYGVWSNPIRRRSTNEASTTYYSGGSGGGGGSGGSGGVGHGYGQSAGSGSSGSGGSSGSAGGTNAGSGGTGGTGGTGGNGGSFGSSGSTGSTGSTGNSGGNGNYTNGSGGSGGSSGSAGGSAGASIRGISNVSYTDNGTTTGSTSD